jgi:hypothetical protein
MHSIHGRRNPPPGYLAQWIFAQIQTRIRHVRKRAFTVLTVGSHRPYAPGRLWCDHDKSTARSVRLIATLDSGAGRSALNTAYLRRLGLNPSLFPSDVGHGFGGTFDYLYAPDIHLQVRDKVFPYQGVFVDFPEDEDEESVRGRAGPSEFPRCARLQLSGSRARLPVWGPWPYAAVAATCAARHVRVGVRALQAPY